MRRVLMALLAAVATGTAFGQARFAFETTPGHLSKAAVPSHYALTLDVDPTRDDFRGEVAITLKLRAAADAIELHAHTLQAGRAVLRTANRARVLVVTPSPQTQTWRLAPEDGRPIPAGAHRLEIAYTGVVRPTGEGLYRAPYGAGGRERMLATQLEAISARMVFPAFDEPAFRARFDIAVRAPAGDEVLSNMPRRSRVDTPDGRALHRFATTPPMPTYLVAVAVGRFDVLADRVGALPLRIFTVPGKREQARHAMAVTREVMPWFARYFGVPYALPKLDQLAVPGTRRGAMEDWGMVSYIENVLLYDPARSSPRTQRAVYAVVAHELAHQWFGNLVTAAYWDEIWLNEAFATWMQTKVTDHFNPAWEVPLNRRVRADEAMAVDVGAATRAIRAGEVRETAVWDAFDNSITYAKGGSVLSMLEQWVGPEVFRRGLAAYMKERRYSNATAGDLWHAIGRAAGRDVASVAASWTDQPGFPQLDVRQTCEAGRLRVALAQRRFTRDGTDAARLWRIPVRLARGEQVTTVMLSGREQVVPLGPCDGPPLRANAGGLGYYRVAYEPGHFKALAAGFARLSPIDRTVLLSDSFALVEAEQLPVDAYLALLAALPQADGAGRNALWMLAVRQLDVFDAALVGTPAQARVRAAGRALLQPELVRLGWTPRPDEDAQTLELRGMLIEQLAKFDDAGSIAETRRRFDAESADQPLPASTRSAIVRAVGIHADRDRFDRLLARLKAAQGEEERWMLARALASGRDAGRADELLAAGLAGGLPNHLAAELPSLVAKHSPFGAAAYRHTVANWTRLSALADSGAIHRLLPDAAAGFTDVDRAATLIEDQARLAGSGGAFRAAREAENIRLRAALKARHGAALAELLERWRPAAAPAAS